MINKLIAYLKTLFGAKPEVQTPETPVVTKAVEMPSDTAEKAAPAKKAKKPRAKKSKN